MTVDIDVPADETPARECRHCGRPFASDHLWALHVGEVHPASADETELDAYEAAHDEESDDLFVYHLKVVAALVFIFFGFTYTYAFVWA